jgi:hypothetical protein
MCTAMLFDPEEAKKKALMKSEVVVTPQGQLTTHRHRQFRGNFRLFERWVRFKQFVLLKSFRRKDDANGPSEGKKSILSFFFW